MGDIADMHIEAFQAGLDPTEMDGADWADFYGENEPLAETDEEAAKMFSSEFRTWMCSILLSRAQDGDTIADVLRRIYPQLSEGQADAFEHLLKAINGLPDA